MKTNKLYVSYEASERRSTIEMHPLKRSSQLEKMSELDSLWKIYLFIKEIQDLSLALIEFEIN